jgi:hypothetical protein
MVNSQWRHCVHEMAKSSTCVIEQHILDANAGKQLSEAATDV